MGPSDIDIYIDIDIDMDMASGSEHRPVSVDSKFMVSAGLAFGKDSGIALFRTLGPALAFKTALTVS